jgi:bacterioferritin
MSGEFVMRIETIRKQAREHIDEGPITSSYGANKERVIKVLNEVLATELVCVLRYLRHYYMAEGIDGDSVKATFLDYSNEERNHADLVATRIVQLGGEPDFNPEVLGKRSHTQYKQGTSLTDMIKEDLVAERIAVSSYQEIIRWLANGDPTTRRVMEGLLAEEEEHADDLRSLLAKMPAK